MSEKHHHVRVLIHRAFAVFLTVFLISDVGSVYASRNLQIIAQQKETQLNATQAEALNLTEEGLQLLFDRGSKESILAARKKFKAALILLELKRKQGNLQASLKHIKKAIAIIEEIRSTYTNQALKTHHKDTIL